MEEISKDKDSMDALQSLLQIRSRGFSDSSVSLSQKDTSTEEGQQKPRLSQQRNSIAGNKRARIDDTSLQQKNDAQQPQDAESSQEQPQEQPQKLLQQQQDAANLARISSSSSLVQLPRNNSGLYLASPAASMTSMGAAATTPNVFAQYQFIAAQAAMLAAASAVVAGGQQQHFSSPQQQPVTPPSNAAAAASFFSLDQQQQQQQYGGNGNGNASSPTPPMAPSLDSQYTSVSTSSGFRREKVEAALRSKPQRGKKRDDLSAKERLELTRTRNREHAKTTRIRKKARYQELLECEAKLQTMLQLQETEDLQRKAVETFISLRQNMIRCCGSSQESASREDVEEETEGLGYDYCQSEASSSQSGKENEPRSAKWSSEGPIAKAGSTTTTTQPVDHASILAKLIVQEEEHFDFQVNNPIQALSDDTMPLMKTLMATDQQLVDRAVERYGVGAQKFFVYQPSSGNRGGSMIAMTKKTKTRPNVTAMVEMDLYMELSPCNRTHLQTCLLKVQFHESQPVLLKSVAWTVLQDNLVEEPPATTAPKGASAAATTTNKTLSRTVSSMFPSIVSLEQSKAMGHQHHA